MISLQTNVDSLIAQRNLSVDNQFQSTTIQQLTSGYRINKSGDDAAGLAIANQYDATIAELTQGVSNANDGTSQLQIVDGGLSNISTILNRLKTLATQSASATFTGDRSTLNAEYSTLTSEITRQATNVNLNSGGSFNNVLNVFVGGGSNTANSSVSVNLSGASNSVDASSLGLTSTNVLNGGVGLGAGSATVTTHNNTTRLDAPGGLFLTSTTASASTSQSFTFQVYTTSGAQQVTAKVTAPTGAGISESNVVAQLNSTLGQYGISAGVDGNGLLQFSGATAFNVYANAEAASAGTAGGTLVSTGALTNTYSVSNTANNVLTNTQAFAAVAASDTENLTFQAAGQTITVGLDSTTSGATLGAAIDAINAKTASAGVYAIANSAGTGIEFQSANSFSINSNTVVTATGATDPAVTQDSVFTNIGYQSPAAPVTGTTNNAQSAITAIDTAIARLGLIQGKVGAGENLLGYATSLAQSQISGFSTAESQIKDADVAAAAANLTKSQVLTQTAVAALAQANSEPQAILKLLQ